MLRNFIFVLLVALALGGIAKSQSSKEIVVQAANGFGATSSPAGAPAPGVLTKAGAAAATSNDAQTISAAIKVLEQLKAANDEVLAKQKAALERLDELQEAADQLQIFAKRA